MTLLTRYLRRACQASVIRSANAAISVLLLCACGQAGDADLRAELARVSSATGLALVRVSDLDIRVLPFDGEQRYFLHRFGHGAQMAFGTAGRMVAIHSQRSILLQPGDLQITEIGGRTIIDGKLPVGVTGIEALNEASGRLAFYGKPAGKESGEGLYWAPFDFGSAGFVDSCTGRFPCCDWAPDGHALAYEKSAGIYVYDVKRGSSKRLASGHEPTWSPDGEHIAYRSPDGHALLMTTEGATTPWPLTDIRVMGAVRWSPSGKYVLFAEEKPLHIPLFGTAAQLVICSVADGRTTVATNFSDLSVDFDSFFWILNYQGFCGDCSREETREGTRDSNQLPH